MNSKIKNIIKALAVVVFLALVITLAINEKKKSTEKSIETINLEENHLESRSINLDNIEQSQNEKYVVYVLARVINTKELDNKNQKYRCIINKEEKGAYTGLVDIVLNSDTIPEIEDQVTDDEKEKIIEEYKADVKVNNTGEWLYINNYYVIEFNEIETSGDINEIKVLKIIPATEAYINEWKQGRILNSTFIEDMEIIKKSNPSDVYTNICNKMQYTWTFEQIETFKAYIEMLDNSDKEEWNTVISESTLKLGY